MRFRENRRTLAESMETVIDIPNRRALTDWARGKLKPWGFNFADDALRVEPYSGDDDRVYPTWRDTHIVTVDGCGVLGFTEGPVPE